MLSHAPCCPKRPRSMLSRRCPVTSGWMAPMWSAGVSHPCSEHLERKPKKRGESGKEYGCLRCGVGARLKGRITGPYKAVGGRPTVEVITEDTRKFRTPTDTAVANLLLEAQLKAGRLLKDGDRIDLVFDGIGPAYKQQKYRHYSGTVSDESGNKLASIRTLVLDSSREDVYSGEKSFEQVQHDEKRMREAMETEQ